jgi:hypothetical protein
LLPTAGLKGPDWHIGAPTRNKTLGRLAGCEGFLAAEMGRQIDRTVALEGIVFNNMRASSVECQIILSDAFQFIAKESMGPIESQQEGISHVKDKIERWVIFGAKEIRRQVLSQNLPSLLRSIVLFA